MADVFLSYAREDRACATVLAEALSQLGWTVWWDRRVQVGRSFSEQIERELECARCVIVLWSRHSVVSDWVRNEAAEAAQKSILVPVRIEDVRIPLEFRRLQTADIFDWQKGFKGDDFDTCLESISSLTGRVPSGRAVNFDLHQSPLAVEPVQPVPQFVSQLGAKSVSIESEEHNESTPTVTGLDSVSQRNESIEGLILTKTDILTAYLLPAIVVLIISYIPLGVVSLVYALQGNAKLARGDVVGAAYSLVMAKRWRWIAVAVGTSVFLVLLVFNQSNT